MLNQIIKEAKHIAGENRGALMSVFLFITLLEMLGELSMQLGILGLLLSLYLVAKDHAYVVSGLKVIGEIDEPINPQQDGFCGIKRLKDLFSTYFMMKVLTIILVIVLSLFVLQGIGLIFNDSLLWQNLLNQMMNEAKYGISDTATQMFNWIIFFELMISVFANFIVNWLFFLAPYILETENISGIPALKKAWHELSKHRKEAFLLHLYYLFFMVFFSCLDYLVMMYVPNLLISTLLSIAVLVISFYVYKMEYTISKALFYRYIFLEGKEEKND